MAAHRTHPFDLVLALRLLSPAGTLVQLAQELAVAPSQVHAGLHRLHRAGLLRPESRAANPRALGEFLFGGVRYAFPAEKGALADGVPTAYSAPALAAQLDPIDVVVWPAARTTTPVRGFSIRPLYAGAPRLVTTSPGTYGLVTLVDALRLGDPRIRHAARSALESALGLRAAGPASPA